MIIMYNIIKSVNYSFTKSTPVIIILFAMFFGPFLFLLEAVHLGEFSLSDLTGEMYFQALPDLSMYYILLGMALCSLACGGDMSDKTINYEIMVGKNRNIVYGGRAVVALVYGGLITIIAMLLPMFVFTLINDWGSWIDFKDAMIRCALLLPIMFRVVALFILVTVLIGSGGVAIIANYLLFDAALVICSLVQEFGDDIDTTFWAGVNSAAAVLSTSSFGSVTGSAIESGVSNDIIIKSIVTSLVVGTLYLIVAGIIFKKRDRK